jgi:hypothetical protein
MASARTTRLPAQKGEYLKGLIGHLCESLCVVKVIPAETPPYAAKGKIWNLPFTFNNFAAAETPPLNFIHAETPPLITAETPPLNK